MNRSQRIDRNRRDVTSIKTVKDVDPTSGQQFVQQSGGRSLISGAGGNKSGIWSNPLGLTNNPHYPLQNKGFRENYQDRFREVKRELIKYIYSTVDISKFSYVLLKNKKRFNCFFSNMYYVSPNYYGKNCLLVFTKLKSKYYSFLIDVKQYKRQLKLSDSNNSINIDNINVDDIYSSL